MLPNNKPLKFLFVFSGPNIIGGIATLMGRMSSWLISKGHSVTIMVSDLGEIGSVIPEGVRVIEFHHNYENLCRYFWTKRNFGKIVNYTPDVIKAFDPRSAWIATILGDLIKPRPKVISGNYGPGFFPSKGSLFSLIAVRLYGRNVVTNYDSTNRLLMSNEQVREMKSRYGEEIEGVFWPLPVDVDYKNAFSYNPTKGLVVSIGRLSPMKEYNLAMLDIVKKLLDENYDLHWEVYGTGSLREPMEKRIGELGLGNTVSLLGNIEYAEIGNALKNAYAFVGMGTAAIEAAASGVPTIVAIAHDADGRTYGPLYSQPFGNCGEMLDEPPKSTIYKEIKRLLSMDEEEHAVEAELCRKSARQYGAEETMTRFMDIVNRSKIKQIKKNLFYIFYLYKALQKLRKLN